MTKKRDYDLPRVRIEPRLFKDAEKDGRRAAARLRAQVRQHLDATIEPRPRQDTIDRLLRDLLAGKDVSRLFSEKFGKQDRRIPRMAAIATEHARLVLAAVDQGATELAAVRMATNAIADKLSHSNKSAAIKAVQRAVNDWWPRYQQEDGSVLIDPRRVVETYQADLNALDEEGARPPLPE